ncbi:MAG: RagB/SusD family nutrient uptake outer membrane protein [Gemmatimonadetes bacterium]|nr:RagB/SusD family nutrient uptake outer membrane protein [Gemmatimonadota bacterium]NIR81550.1 RagB/SusD family nutrient uptake outer membrane protein [Gemmatimonadota bacterium]NIT90391.1 RagB/SusD family nutrient uptake outer membrane protein [Gemmatimonadota bacterium]NIU34219.1 RagB/SusD family nutrient uptake outer membrane protein [Gemmatimonadota bacterium]NIU38362.1 RagB/SusD family nutrient uptake outer membrane protein [Gemmatimonadota bacterium]
MGGLAVILALSLAACDFSVTNPGPAADEFLSDPEAFESVVNGANRTFNNAWNEVARVLASGTREVFPSGNTGNFGINTNERRGVYRIDEQDFQWDNAQQARWVAEDALRRFGEALDQAAFNSNEQVARAYLWAGYANRLLGENFCDVVIDGGSLQEGPTGYLTRAEQHFTDAMSVAQNAGNTEFELAALGARASVRVNLGDWPGAQADAQALLDADDEFVFQTPMSADDTDQYNSIFYSTQNQPYKVHTTWNTFYEDYYATTDDPRTPWITDPDFPEGSFGIGQFGPVPWLPQRKYDARDDPVDLTDAREMMLILAEYELVMNSDPAAAGDIINNDIRATVPGVSLPDWPVGTMAEAWTALIRERGIELWLEGRRAGDRTRWAASPDMPWQLRSDIQGSLDVHEIPSDTEPDHERGSGTFLDLTESRVCIPVPDSERDTNPNVPPA